MSYEPRITTPLIFAYNTSSQPITTNSKLDLDSSLYQGDLSSNDLTQIKKSSTIADVKYTMSSSGLRSYTTVRADTTESVSRGFNVNGSGGGGNGVSDELSYSTFGPTALNIFCDPKFTSGITMNADYTRLSGVLLS